MSEDLRSLHLQKRRTIASNTLLDEALRDFERIGPSAAKGGDDLAGLGKSGPGAGDFARAGRVGGSVGANILEFGSGKQWVGGVIDAAKEAERMSQDLVEWTVTTLGGDPADAPKSFSDFSFDFVGGEKRAEGILARLLPDVKQPETAGGKVARTVSKFLTGFIATKKLPGIGKLGAATGAAARGAITDFALFDPHEARLSNLIQKVPALRNPVTEYLSADPIDTAIEGRFKNAVEGLGIGVMAEGLIRSVKLVRSARLARMAAPAEEAGETAADSAARVIQESDTQRARLVELLGDPEAPVVSVRNGALAADRPPADLAEKLATGSADDAREVYINWARIDSPDDVKSVMQKMADTYNAPEVIESGSTAFRVSRRGATLSDPPQGLYVSIVDDVEQFVSPHADEGAETLRGVVRPRNPLVLSDVQVPHARFKGVGGKGPASAGVAALRYLTSETEFGRLAVARKSELASEISEKFGISAAGHDFDSYQLLEVYGAQLAKRRGHDALVLRDVLDPNFSEAVILDSSILGKEGGREITRAQRGVRSWAETRLSAAQEDAWSLIANRRTGEAFNAEQATAARELWVRSGTKLQSIARIISSGDKSDAARIAFEKQIGIHRVIQQEVIGARTETARALNAWKIPVSAGADGAMQMEQLRYLLDTGGSAEKLAAKIVSLGERGRLDRIEKMIEPSFFAKSGEALKQLYYSSMLSGAVLPGSTGGRVVVANTSASLMTIATRKGANLLGKVLGKENVPDGETLAFTYAMMKGYRDSLRISADGLDVLRTSSARLLKGDVAGARAVFGGTADEFGAFYRALVTGETGISRGLTEGARRGAFDPEKWGWGRDTFQGRALDLVDTATSLPGRALSATDEVFAGGAFRGEIAARAWRQATEEARSGTIAFDDIAMRSTEIADNPDDVVKMAANALAEQHAMRHIPDRSSSTWKTIRAMRNAHIGPVPVGLVAMPFPRTTYAMATFTYQHTLLAPLVESWRKELMRGGADADIALTKMAGGTMLLATFIDMAMEGKIPGFGGGDPDVLASREAQGIQNQSYVTDEGLSVSLRGLGPLTDLMLLAGNLADIIRVADWEDENKELSDLILASSLAVGQQTLSAPYMRGAVDIVGALSGDVGKGEQTIGNLLGVVVPTAVGNISRINDPAMKEALTISDRIKRRYQSDALELRRDRWGRPMTYASGLGTFVDAVNPAYAKTVHTEPIDAELDRLETGVTKPGKRTSINGVTINFEQFPRAYSRYVELSGQAALEHLNAVVSGSSPQSRTYLRQEDGPEGGKAMMIENIVNAHRAKARVQLLGEFPDLRAHVERGIAEKRMELGVSP